MGTSVSPQEGIASTEEVPAGKGFRECVLGR